MSILMCSPEGAQELTSTTRAAELKLLGWKERTWAEFNAAAKREVPSFLAGSDESVTMDAPAKKRMGRPAKVQNATVETDYGDGTDSN